MMKKSPLSRSSLTATGAWEDATIEWNKREDEGDSESEVTIRQRKVSIPDSEFSHLLATSPLPRHRSTSLAKTLATKALQNAHRRKGKTDTVVMMEDDPSYVMVKEDQQQMTSSPYVETAIDGVMSPNHQSLPSVLPPNGVIQAGLSSLPASPLQQQALPMRMPEPVIPSTVQQQPAVPSMPEPHVNTSLSRPMKMPEPYLERLRSSPAMPAMPIPSLPQAATMSMPEAAIPAQLTPFPASAEMPIPQIPSTAYMNRTPEPSPYVPSHPSPSRVAGAAIIPDSTYDPASLQPPQWTDTRTPAITTLAEDDESVLAKMKMALEHLPQSLRATLPKDELVRILLEAVEAEHHQEGMIHDQQQAFLQEPYYAQYPYPYPYPYGHTASVGGPEVYIMPIQPSWPTAEYPSLLETSANDWFRMNGGGELPLGWTAHFDYRIGRWYFTNHGAFPPTTTWQDPRIAQQAVSMPPVAIPTTMPASIPLHHAPEVTSSRQEADHLANQFIALEAQRQYTDHASGPVSAELNTEQKQAKEISEVIKEIQQAQQRANEAIVDRRTDDFQIAQQDMVKARGKLDRLVYEANLRKAALAAVVPSTLQRYQGVTRGFEVDQAFTRPRTSYTDSKILPPSLPMPSYPPHMAHLDPAGMPVSTSFGGRVMGKLFKQRPPNNAYMPMSYPLPPGVRYKASTTTPTPYSMPEFLFSWDMLLRNRRIPNTVASFPSYY